MLHARFEFSIQFHLSTDKIKKRYGNLGTVLCHTIDRGHNSNIGISLAGHRDRNKMACFIAGINPKGVASSGGLEIGDEILEVNNEQRKEKNFLNFRHYRSMVLCCMDDVT